MLRLEQSEKKNLRYRFSVLCLSLLFKVFNEKNFLLVNKFVVAEVYIHNCNSTNYWQLTD